MKDLALRFLVVLAWCAVLPMGAPVRPANAASLVVNSLNDTFDAVCDAAHCSLRDAIHVANNTPADDTITFSVNGTITPVGNLPQIVATSTAGTLMIDGGGNIILSGQSAGRLLWVRAGANLTLQNLTITGASISADGAGVANFGTLAVRNATFSNNVAAAGGGIANFNGATLNVANSTFSSNRASNGGGALANYAGGVVSVDNSTFTGNTTDNKGGGLWNAGSLTVNNSAISANIASADGGGIANFGALTVNGVTFDRNRAISKGGALYNEGTASVSRSIVDANRATLGGGMYSGNAGGLALSKSAVVSNIALHSGGGIYNVGASETLVSNSTFADNRANVAGGGIANAAGTLTVVNATLSGNGADVSGGGLSNSGSAALQNTIVANSVAGKDCASDGPTSSLAAFHTLIESTGPNACNLTNSNGNRIGVAPNLGNLTGAPAYFPLNTGSPAIDAGDNISCAAPPINNQSQNGIARPADGNGDGLAVCDIGAVEAPASPRLFLPVVRRSP
ncbi:MAG: choice-of-anchor Q domain-containing protein [Candidatus Brachytrichaceae bacterium NZ_4S206]